MVADKGHIQKHGTIVAPTLPSAGAGARDKPLYVLYVQNYQMHEYTKLFNRTFSMCALQYI